MNYYGPRPLLKEDADRSDWGEEDVRGYHYTRRNDSRVWPLGYCAGPPVTTREQWEKKMGQNGPARYGWDDPRADDDKEALEANRILAEEFGGKYHEFAHDTKEAAIECYTEYALDQLLAFWHTEPTTWRKRKGVRPTDLSEPVTGDDVPPDVEAQECRHPDCETLVAYPTTMIAVAGSTGNRMHICGDHADQDSLEEWWSAPSSSMSSF